MDEDTSWITSSVLKLIYVLKSKNYVMMVAGNLIYEISSLNTNSRKTILVKCYYSHAW